MSDVCSPDGQCVYNPSVAQHECQCNQGFQGNGIICRLLDECSPNDDCEDQNAHCIYDSISQRYSCECNPGYHSSGNTCQANEDAPCNFVNNCDAHATCKFNIPTRQYKCECSDGYKGNGKACEPAIISCNILNNCDVKAECKYSHYEQSYRCQCIDGYQGDGRSCKPARSCLEDLYQCDSNADCTYLNEFGSYGCQCKAGFVGDGFYCKVSPRHKSDHLVFAHGMSILQMPLNPTKDDKGQLILLENRQIPVGLDADCFTGEIYWADVFHQVIHKSTYNGSMTEIFLSGPGSPEGIAIDWVSRNIYWTDSVKDTIEVANLESKKRKVLINDGLVDPRGIVVHPGYGKMYWTDWNRASPKIEVSNMDGSGRNILVSGELGLPNMLAIDYATNDLCWTDAGLRRIECLTLEGRRTVYSPAAYPFDLTFADGHIYWTDWEVYVY